MRALLFIFLIGFFHAAAQDSGVPVLVLKGRDTSKPLLFYISGDGGIDNSFSHAFMKQFQEQDYSIIGMDSRRYFWVKKTPEQAARDIGAVLTGYLKEWKCKSFVLIGYSFGADVTAFIQRRFTPDLYHLTRHIILMSPSRKTDFEIHLLGMIGLCNNKGASVQDEINHLNVPATIIFGKSEEDLYSDSIKAKNVQIIKIPGGHHYHRDISGITRQIINVIK